MRENYKNMFIVIIIIIYHLPEANAVWGALA